ncbi:hypothetical protein KC340_g47 [Hortaea werneckii]|nr:hypothetical protein KC340_g47 [Hortaea werneckii]
MVNDSATQWQQYFIELLSRIMIEWMVEQTISIQMVYIRLSRLLYPWTRPRLRLFHSYIFRGWSHVP